jgi:Tol biopolymer transport system component
MSGIKGLTAIILIAGLLGAPGGSTTRAKASPVPFPPEIRVMNADGSENTSVSRDAPASPHMRWSPISLSLLWMELPYETARLSDLMDDSERGLGSMSLPVFSPDGGRIAYSWWDEASGVPQIWVMDLTTGDKAKITDLPGYNVAPSWSPDGSLIAFVSRADQGRPSVLEVISPDGTGRRDLGIESYPVTPSWSPAGDHLAYLEWDASLRILQLSTGEVTEVVSKSDPSFSWSPDGTRLVFAATSESPTWDIRMHTIGTVGSSVITRGQDPDWSPSGERIVFSRDGDIWTMSPDGNDQVNLTRVDLREDRRPLWSHDGSKIAYVGNRYRPPPPVHQRSITLELRKHLVLRGRIRSQVDGCAQGVVVRVQRATRNGWRTLRRVETDRHGGNFRAKVKDLQGKYRVVVPELTLNPDGERCERARSQARRHRH